MPDARLQAAADRAAAAMNTAYGDLPLPEAVAAIVRDLRAFADVWGLEYAAIDKAAAHAHEAAHGPIPCPACAGRTVIHPVDGDEPCDSETCWCDQGEVSHPCHCEETICNRCGGEGTVTDATEAERSGT